MPPRILLAAAAAAACAAATASAGAVPTYSIDAFGAVAGVDTHAAALTNGAAFAAAIAAAAADANITRRGVLVPAGAVYAFLPATPAFFGLSDLTVFLEGTLNVSTSNLTAFPGWPDVWPVLSFTNTTRLAITSATRAGLVNGRGNAWWWYTILVADHRNNLLSVTSSTDFSLSGVAFLNAPQYHVNLHDMNTAAVTGVTVRVDIEDQLDVLAYVGGAPAGAGAREVLRLAGKGGPALGEGEGVRATAASLAPARRAALAAQAHLHAQPWWQPSWALTPPVPMIWALNTDGIDFAGVNVTVTNCSVTNFDDSICVKPSSQQPSALGVACTSGAVIANNAITWGVGISMGSVPPDVGGNCINGVAVTNATFTSPLKALYVKPNPQKVGQNATGIIANVLYQDITILAPVWWSIWVGTQVRRRGWKGG
jgi:polygalacturonase